MEHLCERGENNMVETQQGEQPQKKKSKLIPILLAAILIIGGGAAAFAFLKNLSPKEAYFQAEQKSYEHIVDTFKDRYESELDWAEKTQEKPTESVLELSANVSGIDNMSGGLFSVEQLVNNSKLVLSSQTDLDKKIMSSKVEGNIAGIELENLDVHLTADKLLVHLPFLDEMMQVKGEDIGKILKSLDPYSFTGEESVDFNAFFESTAGLLSEEDVEYFKKEYGEMVFNELPDDSFKKDSETVAVDGDSIKADKITMSLSEDQVKDILTKVFAKMEKDEKLKEIIKEQFQLQQFGFGLPIANIPPQVQEEADSFIEEFETAMKEAQEGIKDTHFPDGINSTIWVKDKLIVKRDFNLKMGVTEESVAGVQITGTQKLDKDKQVFDYDFNVTDQYNDGSIHISGDLSSKDGKAEDTIKVTMDEIEVSYHGTETEKKGKKEFNREFSFMESGMGGKLIWSGDATYEKDNMNSNHKFAIDADGISQDMFSLNLKKDMKLIKGVDAPKEDNVKDLGGMNPEELKSYFEMEVAPKMQQWLFGSMGGF